MNWLILPRMARGPSFVSDAMNRLRKEPSFFYMRDRNPENPGKLLCAGCHQHYLRKTEATEQSTCFFL